MLKYLETLKNAGPRDEKPKKPTSELPIPSLNSKRLVGKELHEYLKDKIYLHAASEEPIQPTENDLQSFGNYLKECVKYEKSLDKTCLGFHVRFGEMLEKYFWLWREEKTKGNIFKSWQDWLKENVGISDGFARKKREIAKIVGDYQRFRFVSISFSEIYNRRNDIKSMLNIYSEFHDFWLQKAL